MNKAILNTLLGIMLSSSLAYAADTLVAPEVNSLSNSAIYPVNGDLPNGDTAPSTDVTLTSVPISSAASEIKAIAKSLSGELSEDKKFTSIDFVDDVRRSHIEATANQLLRKQFCDSLEKFSAFDIFRFTINQASKQSGINRQVNALYAFGTSLRHIATIKPHSVVQVTGLMICDKPTAYHPDLLEVSKILLETGLELANRHNKSVDRFNSSLLSTEHHLRETKSRVAGQIKEAKEAEQALARLEAEREQRRALKQAVRERDARIDLEQQKIADAEKYQSNWNKAIRQIKGNKLLRKQYTALAKKIDHMKATNDRGLQTEERKLKNFVEEQMQK